MGYLRRWLPPLLWMALIFLLSAQPTLPEVRQAWLDLLVKKGGHALAYGVLTWLYLRALRGSSPPNDRLRLAALALALAYAISDELHQAFVPGRNASLLDLAIDGSGAMLALLGNRLWARPPAVR